MHDISHGKYETRLPQIAIDRHLKVSLSEQVAEGLRQAIRTGYYRPGDILPPLGALRTKLGISLRVARDAIQRLTDDSLVLARPRVGCQVLEPHTKCHHGRVLAVASVGNMTTYCHAALLLEIGRLLNGAGYFFETVPLFPSKSGRVDLAPLEDRLRGPVNLVMAYHPLRTVSRRLSVLSVPYVAVGSISGMRSTTYIRPDNSQARNTFVEACVRHGVRRAFVAVYGDHHTLADELEATGIAVEYLSIPVKFGARAAEELERDCMRLFEERFGDTHGRKHLPDVICVCDDFMTRGALTALAHLGIKIPDNVKFVGTANDGAAPATPCSMACFRYNPFENANIVANALLRHLSNKEVSHDIYYAPAFMFGDTFPLMDATH